MKFYMDKTKEIIGEMLDQRECTEIMIGDDFISAIKPNNKSIYVFFCVSPKLNSEKIQEYVAIMTEIDTQHCILIHNDLVTPSAKKLIEHLAHVNRDVDKNIERLKIELFNYREVQFNITKHVLQPQFKLLPPKSSSALKTKYGTKFPVLLKTDMISRFFGYQTGDVIEITRKGYVSYRIVK